MLGRRELTTDERASLLGPDVLGHSQVSPKFAALMTGSEYECTRAGQNGAIALPLMLGLANAIRVYPDVNKGNTLPYTRRLLQEGGDEKVQGALRAQRREKNQVTIGAPRSSEQCKTYVAAATLAAEGVGALLVEAKAVGGNEDISCPHRLLHYTLIKSGRLPATFTPKKKRADPGELRAFAADYAADQIAGHSPPADAKGDALRPLGGLVLSGLIDDHALAQSASRGLLEALGGEQKLASFAQQANAPSPSERTLEALAEGYKLRCTVTDRRLRTEGGGCLLDAMPVLPAELESLAELMGAPLCVYDPVDRATGIAIFETARYMYSNVYGSEQKGEPINVLRHKHVFRVAAGLTRLTEPDSDGGNEYETDGDEEETARARKKAVPQGSANTMVPVVCGFSPAQVQTVRAWKEDGVVPTDVQLLALQANPGAAETFTAEGDELTGYEMALRAIYTQAERHGRRVVVYAIAEAYAKAARAWMCRAIDGDWRDAQADDDSETVILAVYDNDLSDADLSKADLAVAFGPGSDPKLRQSMRNAGVVGCLQLVYDEPQWTVGEPGAAPDAWTSQQAEAAVEAALAAVQKGKKGGWLRARTKGEKAADERRERGTDPTVAALFGGEEEESNTRKSQTAPLRRRGLRRRVPLRAPTSRPIRTRRTSGSKRSSRRRTRPRRRRPRRRGRRLTTMKTTGRKRGPRTGWVPRAMARRERSSGPPSRRRCVAATPSTSGRHQRSNPSPSRWTPRRRSGAPRRSRTPWKRRATRTFRSARAPSSTASASSRGRRSS